jgi:multiple sugar transport system ATP-binding protein
MAAVVAQNLTKRFAEKVAVDNTSFEVANGEFLVLVGPSGCGKTTTLRMLAGLEPVTSGEILFGERDVTNIRAKDRNVGMVFQDYAIFPHMTVFENIAYGLRSRHEPRREIGQRVTTAAKTFRIDHLLQRKPRQLSGGERQRVALSRAMVRDASIYLYDEPLSNLDAQLRYQAREDVMALHRSKQKPSVYVTHDQSEAMALGDRIAVMRNGTIQQIGSGSDLYERPRNRFVAYFIGTPSINLFDVEIRQGDDGQIDATCESFTLPLPDELHKIVAPYNGRQLTLGIRPEDLHVPRMAPFDVTEENTIAGIVNVIEPTAAGSTVYLSSPADDRDFVATFKQRIPSNYLGKEIPLAVNLSKLQLFDIETERSLLHGVTDNAV